MKNQLKWLVNRAENRVSAGSFRMKIMGTALVAVFLGACQKVGSKDDHTESSGTVAKNVGKIRGINDLIACTNSANNRIEVYDPAITDWNTPEARVWWYEPTIGNGYTQSEVNAWNDVNDGNPMGIKLRYTAQFGGSYRQAIVTVAGNLATIASYIGENNTYPASKKLWARVITGGWMHEAELLPNGNLAIVNTNSGWLRLYNTNGTDTNYASATGLTDAHGVLWDPARYVLWVVTGTTLKCYNTGATRTSPELNLISSVNLPVTTPYASVGHDLAPFYGDNDKLLITASHARWVYSKSNNTFVALGGNDFKVKGIGNRPASVAGHNQIVECREAGGNCLDNGYCSRTVEFYNYDNNMSLDYMRTRSTAQFYKARVFSPEYQDAPAFTIAAGNYKISSQLGTTHRVLAVGATAVADGDPVQLATYTTGSVANDEWVISQLSNGYYRIKNRKTLKDIVIQSAGADKNDASVQYSYSADDVHNDEWSIVPVSPGSNVYKIVNRNSNLVLNVYQAVDADGQPIKQYTYTNVAQSTWTFTTVQ